MKYREPVGKIPSKRARVKISPNRAVAAIIHPSDTVAHTLTINRKKRGSNDWWAVTVNPRGQITFDGSIDDAENATPRQVLTLLAEREGLV